MSDDDKKISLPIAGSDSVEDNEAGGDEEAAGDGGVLDRIDQTVSSNPLVLYMKGTPQQPMCGFSARAAAVLSSYGKPFETVNVLADPEVRQGIKEYGDWPTIPQLYIDGELIGGSDIITKMHEKGQLGQMIEEAFEGA
ncbi:MAG: Grx4 family monothiol glutaredoxin [Persicimonas sp.]